MIRASWVEVQGVELPLQPRVEVVLTSTTLPEEPLRLMAVELRSAATESGEPFAPPASCTRKYCPGLRVMLGKGVIPELPKLPVPVALAYCSDFPLKEAGAEPRLKISMKSFV